MAVTDLRSLAWRCAGKGCVATAADAALDSFFNILAITISS